MSHFENPFGEGGVSTLVRQESLPELDVVHLACQCKPDLAFCGMDVADLSWARSSEAATCYLCVEVEIKLGWECPYCARQIRR